MTSAEGARPSAYADALRERLRRVRAELESQGAQAVALRHSVEAAKRDAAVSTEELARLRATWAAGQPQREAFLRETGEAERRLAERERRCAEALAQQAASLAAAADEAAQGEASRHAPPGEAARSFHEQRERLTALEQARSKLTAALQELRDASRQETAAITQLGQRGENLRRETRSLKAAVEAARESEARAQRKLEALDATSLASQQRQQAMERAVAEARGEVQALRSELAAVAAAAPDGEDETWEMTRRLEAKVAKLEEELRRKRDLLQRLRAAGPAGGAH